MTAAELVPKAGRREWFGLALLTLPLLVLAFDVSVLYLAAPQLTADLAPTAVQQLWILDIYGFLIAGFLVTMGSLGDRIGRRRLLLIGGAAFAAASVLAAFAPSAELLIAARALLGIAGATLMPSTLALISTMFVDPHQRRFAIAIWMTVFSAGVAVGPVVGGVMLELFWWGSVFLLAVPVMALLVALGPILLPEERGPSAGGWIDLPSSALSLATMLPLVYGFKESVAHGISVSSVTALGIGVGAGVLFVRRQRRLPDPMLDVSLFTRRVFVGAVALMLLGTIAINGVFYLVPQYLQLVRGVSALAAGLWMIPIAGVSVLASLCTPRLARQFGRRALLAGAGVLAAAGCLGLTFLEVDTALPILLVCVSLAVLGNTPTGVLGTDLVVSSAPPERAGSAAAIAETAGETGVGVGVALTGTLVAAVYQSTMADQLPATVPTEAAAAANEGVAAAESAARALPTEVGVALVDTARTAFTTGFAAAGYLGAALVACIVGLVLLVVPSDRGEGSDESGSAGEEEESGARLAEPTS
ncbi:MFS transporter [Nocardia mangyaensis]|uniref:MFS transporter n=1 Tax=Nocardia mangyaensis TaxID=2213200 RepID=UPI0026746E86|nr:MFS transporter [Nocardia mangyaensis]MDO3646373.1 MFS transporter [Nocardia mangyaensis]